MFSSKFLIAFSLAVAAVAQVGYLFWPTDDEGARLSFAEVQERFFAEADDDVEVPSPGESLSSFDDENSNRSPQVDNTLDDLVANRVLSATVRIIDPASGSIGSGAVVATTPFGFDFVTANHVIEESDVFFVESFPPSARLLSNVQAAEATVDRFEAIEVIDRDATRDLAYLRVNTGEHAVVSLRLGSADAESSSFEAWAIDGTGSGVPVIRPVEVVSRQSARRTSDAEPVSYWRLATASAPGMSGSGLVNRSGELVGIASGNSGKQAYYCDDQELAAFCQRAIAKE